MNRSWKLAALSAIFALGVLALLPGGPARPDPAFAAFANCGSSGETLRVRIVNNATGDPITTAGSTVRFTPDTDNGNNSEDVDDSTTGSGADSNTGSGLIDQADACNTTGASTYTVNLVSLTPGLSCDFVDGTERTNIVVDGSVEVVTVTFRVENCVSGTQTPTPIATGSATPTATGTITAASAVTVSASPNNLGCSGSSFVTVMVKNAAGANVPDGTAVSLTATAGSVSPAQATTFGGGILAVYTGPASSGGDVTINVTAGTASGSTTLQVACGSAAATNTPLPPAPVATQATVPVISPPNTGDGGLGRGNDWPLYAGVLLIAGSLAGAGLVLRKPA